MGELRGGSVRQATYFFLSRTERNVTTEVAPLAHCCEEARLKILSLTLLSMPAAADAWVE